MHTGGIKFAIYDDLKDHIQVNGEKSGFLCQDMKQLHNNSKAVEPFYAPWKDSFTVDRDTRRREWEGPGLLGGKRRGIINWFVRCTPGYTLPKNP